MPPGAIIRGGLNTYSTNVTGGTGYPGDAATGHGVREFIKWVDALEPRKTRFLSSLTKLTPVTNPKPEFGIKAKLPHRVTLGAAMTAQSGTQTMTLAAGHGVRVQQGQLIFIPQDTTGNPYEIVWVSAEPSGDTLTVERGYAGTTGVAHDNSVVCELIAPAMPELSDHPRVPIVFGNLFYNHPQRMAGKIEVDLREDATPNLEYPGANIFEARLKEAAEDAKYKFNKALILGQRSAGDPNPAAKRPSTFSGLRHFCRLSGNVYDLNGELLNPWDIETVFRDLWQNVDEGVGKEVVCSMNTAVILDSALNPLRQATVNDDEASFVVRRWNFRVGTVSVIVDRDVPDGEMYVYDSKHLGYAPYQGLDWHFARKKAGVDTDGDYVQGSISGDFTFFAFAPPTMAFIGGWNRNMQHYPIDLAA